MDAKLTAEILATCDNIGYSDEEKYYKDPSCLECVKDLVLYLRRDDDDHSVRRLLGTAQVLQRDLLPLLKHYSDDRELYDIILRLLLNLTTPALLLYDEQVPKNKKYLSQYLEIEKYLRAYKEAFVDKDLWAKITERLRHLATLEWEKQREDDKMAFERILVLMRNVLMVPADPSEEKRTDDENSLHDRLLMVMHVSGVEEILLLIATSGTTREYSLHVLEILSLMLREQTGEQIAKTQLTRNEEDSIKDERELIKIREKEMARRNLQKFSTRHSRFGGTFSVRDMKAPSGRDLLCHKPINSTADLSLDSTKKTKRTASNRMPIREDNPTRRSTIPVRIILKEFASKFLAQAYNSIMRGVRDTLARAGQQEHDETYYLWALKFFMEFNRHHEFKTKYVRETISINTFHYVQGLLENYNGMMVTDKDKIPFWSKRAHAALKAYQELLFSAYWMDKYGDEDTRLMAKGIKKEIFYMPEYRELCYSQINLYDPVKQSKLYLEDLIETNHIFLKMLEEYTQARTILIRTKGKKRKKKSKGKAKNVKKSRKTVPKDDEELEELWSTVSEAILTAVETGDDPNENENVIPFDATSDVEIEDQSSTALERISIFLHTKKYNEALALLRASREVWSEMKEEFGERNPDPMEETLVLKSIFLNKTFLSAVNLALQENEEEGQEQEEGAEQPEEQNENEDDEEENELESEEEEEAVQVSSKEQEFDFLGFVFKYAAPKIVCNYAKVFRDWEKVKPFTLQCVLKMFHRFVFQMDYPALLCQASIFRTFQKILQVSSYQSDLKEATKFFYHFWPKFVKLCERDKGMFVEILFWKTAREAQEIQDGYSSMQAQSQGGGGSSNRNKKSGKLVWTNDEEDELALLAEDYNALPDEAKKATKMIAWIKERWTRRPKSRKVMISKLIEKGLVDPSTETKKPRRRKGAKAASQQVDNPTENVVNQYDTSDSEPEPSPGTGLESDKENEATNVSRNIVDSDSDDEFENALANWPGKSANNTADKEVTTVSNNSQMKTLRVDSDLEDEMLEDINTPPENDEKSPVKGGIHSDSDNENENEVSRNSQMKTLRVVDSDSDFDEIEGETTLPAKPVARKTIIDSDSDDGDEVTLNATRNSQMKTLRVVDSDEDHDEVETPREKSLSPVKVGDDESTSAKAKKSRRSRILVYSDSDED